MKEIKDDRTWDFLSGPVVKNPPSNAGNACSSLGQGTKVPHAAGQLSSHATTTELRRPNKRAHELQTAESTHSGAHALLLQSQHALEPAHLN